MHSRLYKANPEIQPSEKCDSIFKGLPIIPFEILRINFGDEFAYDYVELSRTCYREKEKPKKEGKAEQYTSQIISYFFIFLCRIFSQLHLRWLSKPISVFRSIFLNLAKQFKNMYIWSEMVKLPTTQGLIFIVNQLKTALRCTVGITFVFKFWQMFQFKCPPTL